MKVNRTGSKQVSRVTSVPAPVGGLNDRDALAEMQPTDAIILDNWWTYPSYVGIRKGRNNWVTGFALPVETLVEYLPNNGVSQLFAASGTAIYDVTTSGVVGAAVVSGLANARFQDAQISTPGGSFLYLVNGVDNARLWNGTVWNTITAASTPAITGVDTTLLNNVSLFKNRLWFVERNSLRCWYLPTNAIAGGAQLFDFGAIFRLGGNIVGCFDWTLDAGTGADDHFVVISSNGEVVVYKGTDPASISTWALVGVFTLGRPIGKKCATKYAGDLAINTNIGVFPLGRGLMSSSIDHDVAFSDKIQNSINFANQSYGTNYGGQVVLYPDANMLLVNVAAGNGQNFQYVQNTITQAWSKFIGWDARVFLTAVTGLYYGDSNSVQKAWVGNADNGVPIQSDVLTAFSYFGSEAQNKLFSMVRPYLLTSGQPSVIYGMNTNFVSALPSGNLSFMPPTGMVWGSMSWGSMKWGGLLTSIANWQSVGAIGNSAALRMRVQNNGAEVRFTNTDFNFETGGVL